MRLANNYYKLVSLHCNGASGTFRIRLCRDCDVYRGHFPGHPVCPGAYNIQTVKECAEWLIGRQLHISYIKQCRLTAVATPDTSPEIDVCVSVTPTDTGYNVTARMSDEKQVYMDYKGEVTE